MQKDLRLQGLKTIQTSHNSKGGCLIATNIDRQKNIKTILGNLAWTSVAIRNVPVHIIACYTHSGHGKDAAQDISRLDHVLGLILGRLPNSRVIVAGDFNMQMERA